MTLEKKQENKLSKEDIDFPASAGVETVTLLADEEETIASNKPVRTEKHIRHHQSPTDAKKLYLFLPFLFLTVALLGGLRISGEKGELIFWRPALFCLVAAAFLLVLFFRAGLLKIEGWFSENFSTLKNIANGAVLVTLFAASVQIFNCLLPEQGLPFLIVAFCFFWTLWNNLFAEFDAHKLLRSLGALFGLAFVVKYLILLNLTAPVAESWWQGLWQNPTKEMMTRLLDLPRFSGATGYFQFFTVVFYLLGLFLLPPTAMMKNLTKSS
jgi:hypothetical protein